MGDDGGAADPTVSTGRRWLRWFPTLLACGLVLVGLVGLGFHYWRGSADWQLAGTSGSPYLMLGAPLGLAVALFAHRWWVAVVAVLVGAFCSATQVSLYVATTAPKDAVSVQVMTANLKLGLADPAAVVAAVRSHHVEVLMLEELTPAEQQRLEAAGLDDLLPHSASQPRWGGSGTGLWSRYPLTDVTYPTGFGFAMVQGRIAVPGVTAAPYAIALHMSGPVPDPTGWRQDIEKLPAQLRSVPTDAAVLAAGDFNATPDSPWFRDVLGAGYANANDQAGAGIVPTYPADRRLPPLIAIDHVLSRGGPVATSVRSVSLPGSDHRGLLVTLAVPRS